MAHDVFISYAHRDNLPLVAGAQGWVTSLRNALQHRIQQFVGGAEITVWIDHTLRPDDVVDKALIERVSDSRTFVLVMSNNYLASKWCQMELGTFLEHHPPERNRERVFIAEIFPTNRDVWHPRLRELSQIVFWERRADTPAPLLFGDPVPKPDDGRYWLKVNELAHFIAARIADDRAGEAARRAGPVVWVAETPTEDSALIHQRESLVYTLRQAGANILPGGRGQLPARIDRELSGGAG